MTASWPGGVPYRAQRGTLRVAQPFRAPLKTDMDDGQLRQRRSATKQIATVSFSIKMDMTAIGTFKSWVKSTLVDGTLPFTMNVWTGAAYESKTCTMTAPYQVADALWPNQIVSLTLDVEDW